MGKQELLSDDATTTGRANKLKSAKLDDQDLVCRAPKKSRTARHSFNGPYLGKIGDASWEAVRSLAQSARSMQEQLAEAAGSSRLRDKLRPDRRPSSKKAPDAPLYPWMEPSAADDWLAQTPTNMKRKSKQKRRVSEPISRTKSKAAIVPPPPAPAAPASAPCTPGNSMSGTDSDRLLAAFERMAMD